MLMLRCGIGRYRQESLELQEGWLLTRRSNTRSLTIHQFGCSHYWNRIGLLHPESAKIGLCLANGTYPLKLFATEWGVNSEFPCLNFTESATATDFPNRGKPYSWSIAGWFPALPWNSSQLSCLADNKLRGALPVPRLTSHPAPRVLS